MERRCMYYGSTCGYWLFKMALFYGRHLLTLDQLQVVGNFLQDGEAGQHQAVRASKPSILTAIWPVPLAALQYQHSHLFKHHALPHYMIETERSNSLSRVI